MPPPWAIAHGKWDEIVAGLGVGIADVRHGIFRTDEMLIEYLRSTGAIAQLDRWLASEFQAPEEMIAQTMLFRALVARWDDVNHKNGRGRRAS